MNNMYLATINIEFGFGIMTASVRLSIKFQLANCTESEKKHRMPSLAMAGIMRNAATPKYQ